MGFSRQFTTAHVALLIVGWAWASSLSSLAVEKQGMPDLCQIEQTCMPTAAANLMIWFGHNGYPNLIMDGETQDERYLHTVHRLMMDTNARFDVGTQGHLIKRGLLKYITDAGYNAQIEYRGLGSRSDFSEDWLRDNDDPSKGFLLFFNYYTRNVERDTYTDEIHIGHVVTLVNAEPGLLLIHDPAHREDETGRKIITPQVLSQGTWVEGEYQLPVAGLATVSGSLLEAPSESEVMLTGAICVTMLPKSDPKAGPHGVGPSQDVAGISTGTGHAPAAPPAQRTWVEWLFNLFFSK